MAINVQYGGGAAGSAPGQIIAQSGISNLDRESRERLAGQQIAAQGARLAQELQARQQEQLIGIDARAESDKQAAAQAMKVTALKAGLGQQMAEQEYEMQISKMQEQARIDAEQWEFKISEGDKRELAKIENDKTALEKAFRDGIIDEEEFMRAKKDREWAASRITPTRRAAIEKPPAPETTMSVDKQSGALMGHDRDGQMRVLVQPDKMPSYLKAKAEQDMREKRFDSEIDLRKSLEAIVITTEVEAKGGGTLKIERRLTESEKNQSVRNVFGAEEQPQQEEIPRLKEGPTGPESDWWNALESQGIKVSEERRKMPLEQGSALSLYDAYVQKFGSFENVPDELKPAFAEIIKTIRKHRGK